MSRFRLSFIAVLAVIFAPIGAAQAFTDYQPGMIKEALARGETVFVDYAADWCITCKTQKKVITALRAENPDYDQKLTFIRVDWDDFKDHDIRKSYAIPRRSTLLVLKGEAELGRIVAGTNRDAIRSLMDIGL